MLPRLLADAVLLLHFAFIVFVVLGGLPALRWPWVAALHVPAAVWGGAIELSGGLCPLTTLENRFRLEAGLSGYATSFVEHYLFGVIYPEGLTRGMQVALGVGVVVVNVAVYAVFLARRRRVRREAGGAK